MFSSKFCEILRTPFLQSTTGWLFPTVTNIRCFCLCIILKRWKDYYIIYTHDVLLNKNVFWFELSLLCCIFVLLPLNVFLQNTLLILSIRYSTFTRCFDNFTMRVTTMNENVTMISIITWQPRKIRQIFPLFLIFCCYFFKALNLFAKCPLLHRCERASEVL